MAALDLRRRPVGACVGYGVALLVLSGWSTSQSPAFAPFVPSGTETAAALALTVPASHGGDGRRPAHITGPMIQGANSSSPTPASSLLLRLPEATATTSSKI